MKLYIHYTDGEWKGFEGPEENISDKAFEVFKGKKKKFIDDAFKGAAKNSLKILNQEAILNTHPMIITKGEPLEKGKYYQWPGTYEINEYCRKCAESLVCVDENMCSAVKMIKLTPPAALEEESIVDKHIEDLNELQSLRDRLDRLGNEYESTLVDLAAERKKNEELEASLKFCTYQLQWFSDNGVIKFSPQNQSQFDKAKNLLK